MSRGGSALAFALVLLAARPVVAALDVRLQALGSDAWLPADDVQRAADGSPVRDGNLDLRLLFSAERDAFHLTVDQENIVQAGDSYAFRRSPLARLQQTPTDDDRRLFDLTWTVEDGARHRSYQRFDRLALQYRGDGWNVTAGRQAVSWGSGIVFQPLDLFAPFAPTTVDRDYKPGEDLILVDRLNGDGSDVQLLGVFRRDGDGDRGSTSNSLGGKWHRSFGASEVEAIAGRHYRDRVWGGSVRTPLGGALARVDLLATDREGSRWSFSGIANVDYSFELGARNVYVFGEYFRNGFGMGEDKVDLTRVPERLRQRLLRGEVFDLLRDYLAVGTSIEWHPLWTQTLTLIGNLHDGSTLVQAAVRHEPSDATRLELGLIDGRGRKGDEFGAVPVTDDLTTGGGIQVYLRFVYFR